jgi:hypothetical protein
MTRLSSLLLGAVMLLAACGNNKSKESNSTTTSQTNTENSGTTTTNPATNTDASNDMAKAMEEMKKMPALSTDQLKAMLPENLMGMKRSSFSANSMMGYGVAEARYKSDDGKQLHLSIFDCAGVAGSAYYSMMYWGMNMEREDENGYEKTTTFNGAKAIEKYQKGSEEYTLTFPASNRLLVTVEGEQTGLDMVKQAAGSLNLKVN